MYIKEWYLKISLKWSDACNYLSFCTLFTDIQNLRKNCRMQVYLSFCELLTLFIQILNNNIDLTPQWTHYLISLGQLLAVISWWHQGDNLKITEILYRHHHCIILCLRAIISVFNEYHIFVYILMFRPAKIFYFTEIFFSLFLLKYIHVVNE